MGPLNTVITSPHRHTIEQRLAAGDSPWRVHAELVEQHGADSVPSAGAVYRFRLRLFPNAARREDDLGLLDKMVRLQERRIARLWKRDDADTMPQLDAALRTLLGYLRERRRLAEAPDASAGLSPAASGGQVTREELQEVLDLLERHRARFEAAPEPLPLEDSAPGPAEGPGIAGTEADTSTEAPVESRPYHAPPARNDYMSHYMYNRLRQRGALPPAFNFGAYLSLKGLTDTARPPHRQAGHGDVIGGAGPNSPRPAPPACPP